MTGGDVAMRSSAEAGGSSDPGAQTSPTQDGRSATSSGPSSDMGPRGPRGLRDLARLSTGGPLVGLAAVIIFALIAAPGFLTVDNLRNLVSQNSPTGIVALAMTFLIISGDFDLSVGGVYAMSAVEFASIAQHHSIAEAAVAALLIGLVAGLINGVIVVALRVNSFIATLGTGSIFTGIAYVLSHNTAIFVTKASFSTLGSGQVAGVPWDMILLLVLAVIGAAFLRLTPAGRHVFAIGSNSEASRLAGVRVAPLRLALFALVGVAAALGGMVFSSQVSVGQATIGTTLALNSIAIVVIGGTALAGGEGGIMRTIVGLAILAVLNNAFDAMAVNSSVQLIVQGGVLVFAVAANAGGITAVLEFIRRPGLSIFRPASSSAPDPSAES